MATRANLESILVKRLGPLMSAAGMAITVAGSNADLNDPLGYALRTAGYSVTDITSVADADIANVSNGDLDKVILLAEWRTLDTVLGNLDDVDTTVGPRSLKLSQLAGQAERKFDRLEKRLMQLYNIGVRTGAGVLVLNISAKGDDDS